MANCRIPFELTAKFAISFDLPPPKNQRTYNFLFQSRRYRIYSAAKTQALKRRYIFS
jgi:hypothetical protein